MAIMKSLVMNFRLTWRYLVILLLALLFLICVLSHSDRISTLETTIFLPAKITAMSIIAAATFFFVPHFHEEIERFKNVELYEKAVGYYWPFFFLLYCAGSLLFVSVICDLLAALGGDSLLIKATSLGCFIMAFVLLFLLLSYFVNWMLAELQTLKEVAEIDKKSKTKN